jgi:hypothetical protein
MEPTTSISDQALTAEDRASIVQASRDYVEGWYEADPERMARALHPDLVKRTVGLDGDDGKWRLLRPANAEMMVGFTREGGGSAVPEAERIYDISIQDGFRHIACVRALSPLYMDYLHLAKFDDGWVIVNVIWEAREGVSPF